MYATTGRNAPLKKAKVTDDSNIEMITPAVRTKWYSRVPLQDHRMQNYTLGDEDDEEDELAPR